MAPYWARNGSYLVYRRLRQDVTAFNRFLEYTVQQLVQSPGFATMTVEPLGALLVGRWKSGAPLMRAPDRDNPLLGKSVPSNNAFAYGGALANPQDGFPFTPDDRTGTVCPFTSHIRKVNPRDVTTEQIGSPAETLARRILRRGIPFGPPLAPGATSDPAKEERGLLFLSYQTSISKQFEFLCQQWMNHSEFPTGSQGFDMILGQKNPQRVRTCLLDSSGKQASISTQNFNPKDWVVPTGGGYFFAPSLSAMRDVLCSS